jgi:hypothetical protein
MWFFMEREENWINLMLLYGFEVNDTSHKGWRSQAIPAYGSQKWDLHPAVSCDVLSA